MAGHPAVVQAAGRGRGDGRRPSPPVTSPGASPPRPPTHRGRAADGVAERDAHPDRVRLPRAGGLRGAHQAVRRRRLARAAHAAGVDPRLRRAVPPGCGARRRRAPDDAADRGRGHPDGRPRRGPAHAGPARRAPPGARRTGRPRGAGGRRGARRPGPRPGPAGAPGGPGLHRRDGRLGRPTDGPATGRGPVPAVVVGDEGGLRQVVVNLVANAVRHTPRGTPVEVAVGVDAGQAVLEVRDHGPGLPPEEASASSSASTGSTPAGGADPAVARGWGCRSWPR